MLKKIVILDKDGVINIDTHYPYKIEEIAFLPNIFRICRYLNNLNYEIVVITNQSGIGRGYFSTQDFLTLRDWIIREFEKQNIKILEFLHCPHKPSDNCSCRKPNTALYEYISERYCIDKSKSWAIGDKPSDIIAAKRYGIDQTVLISNDQVEETTIENFYLIHDLIEIKDIIKS